MRAQDGPLATAPFAFSPSLCVIGASPRVSSLWQQPHPGGSGSAGAKSHCPVDGLHVASVHVLGLKQTTWLKCWHPGSFGSGGFTSQESLVHAFPSSQLVW